MRRRPSLKISYAPLPDADGTITIEFDINSFLKAEIILLPFYYIFMSLKVISDWSAASEILSQGEVFLLRRNFHAAPLVGERELLFRIFPTGGRYSCTQLNPV